MDKEKTLKIASSKLESKKTHRIDLLRQLSGMDLDEFDLTIMELAQAQKLELVGGDTSGMTDRQMEGLIKFDGNVFVNIVWTGPTPAKGRGRLARDGRENITLRLPQKMVERLRASGQADQIVEEALNGPSS